MLTRQLAEAADGYFEPVAAMPGFATALHRTVRELRQAMIDPDKLAGEGEKLNALAELYQRHEQDRDALCARRRAGALPDPDVSTHPRCWYMASGTQLRHCVVRSR